MFFSYITVRAILALLTALLFCLWIRPKVIRKLQLLQIGQVVRNDGPESHFSKRGTVMGGIMILASRGVAPCCGRAWITLMSGCAVCVVWLWCGRFVDDYRKLCVKYGWF